jgi:AcrR family transcriptional regulator
MAARPTTQDRAVSQPVEAGLTARAELTRAAIVDAALRLFREHGYEAATMRAIARAAGVSTGNAYYYFSSKEELIQEFYLRNHAEHAAACRNLLDGETEFSSRLRGTLRALIDVLNPYHSFAAAFYKYAAEPTSPLSPFSKESTPAKDASIALFRDVADGSSARIDRELRAELPELLWLYSLGIVLFWVHDRSPACAKTYRLIDATVPLADRLLALTRVPVLRGTAREIVAIIREIRQ